MFFVGMAGYDDHARPVSDFSALTSRLWTEGRRAQTHAMPSVKVLSVREAVKGAAQRSAV